MKLKFEFLQFILDTREIKQSDLASELDITPQAIKGWEKENSIPEKRISSISNFLKLSPQEVDRLLGREPLHYSFRTKNGKHLSEEQASERMKSRSEIIFERFFGDSSICNFDLKPLRAEISQAGDDFIKIADAIRKQFIVRGDAPISHDDTNSIIEKLNSKAFFLPFKQIKLNVPNENDQTAVLYCRNKSYSILVDSDRTIDEAHFDKLHEIVHIFFMELKDQDIELEKLIDKICGELVYPKQYIIDKFFDGIVNSRPGTDLNRVEEIFEKEHRARKFLISPKGLARAMRDTGLTSRNSDLYDFLYFSMNDKFKQNAITYSSFGCMDFNFSDRNALVAFYKDIVENSKRENTYPLFEKLKQDFLSNSLQASDFADTFSLKLSDAYVLKSIWSKEESVST